MIEIPVKISSGMQNSVAHLMYNYNDIWSIIVTKIRLFCYKIHRNDRFWQRLSC